ncbi:MAG: hypothetical protein K2O29_06040 [Ruminococcus sp.]|nr:hypothetical protein [Ruminococcus sp.]MDE6848437.1 hypothetical protein [Ruminococcus sp.]MDE7138002.1 hypothetical protein [Ruminococcus sp.]
MKANVVNVKKVTAVVIAFLMMILSVVYANSKSEAANTARKYRIFNAKTGVQIGDDYTLNALKSENNSLTVIGDYDERKKDYSKKGTVRLIMNYGEYVYCGSGFVVDSHTIATATHCVYNLKISNIILFNSDKNRSFANPVEYHNGESGGPVYIEETLHNQDNHFNCYSVIAIHTNGENSGTRITTDLIHFYKQNPNIN